MDLMNVLVMFFTVQITYGARNTRIICNEENRLKANECAEKLFFVGKNSRPYPATEELLHKHCRESTDLMTCVTDFTDVCRAGIRRAMATVMVSTVRLNQRNYCTRPNKRHELLSLSTCGNAIRGQTSACMEQFLTNLSRARSAVKKYRVPHGCCAYYEMKACIMRAARQESQHKCSGQRLDHLEKYINAMAGNTLNMMCGEYEEESNKCARLPPLPTGVSVPAPTIFAGFGDLIL